MGAFPHLSRLVPVCPLLSFVGPGTRTNRDKRGQRGTKQDISGQIGKRPPFRIYPRSALLKKGSSVSWVTKCKGDKKSECKLSNGQSRSDKTASFCREMSGREVTGRQIRIPIFHGTSLPMDFWTPPRFLTNCFVF